MTKLVKFCCHVSSGQVAVTLQDKCLVEMENALCVWVEDRYRKHVLTAGMLNQSSQGCEKNSATDAKDKWHQAIDCKQGMAQNTME